MEAKFVADVGGTNIRIARVTNGNLVDIERFKCAQFNTIVDALLHYFEQHSQWTFQAGCIAIACPTDKDWIAMTNHDWSFSVSETLQALQLKHLDVINDYTAIAMCLPELDESQVVMLGGEPSASSQTKAVFGPGTGLGVALLESVGDKWLPVDGEGGHADFAPIDDTDLVVWKYLTDSRGRASMEEVLSGRGLHNVYTALCRAQGKTAVLLEPSDVSNAAIQGDCELSVASLALFCRAMGSFAGNLALTSGALGGVYIAGGIASRFVEFLQASDFRQRFEAKGRFNRYLSPIPTYLITEPDHGLIGAAAHLNQALME